MKKVLALTLLSCAALAPSLTSAQTADIKVSGRLVPRACQLAFSGNNGFDFGTVNLSQLHASDATPLPVVWKKLAVTCPGGNRIALRMTDNRAGTAAAGTGEGYDFGLGGKNTGSYTAKFNAITDQNGKRVEPLIDETGNGDWKLKRDAFKPDGVFRMAFSSLGATDQPWPFLSLSGEFAVYPVINKRSELDSGTGIELDGSATLEVLYL